MLLRFLGDLVFLGLYPQECFDLLGTLDVRYRIKGNTDANIGELPLFIPKNPDEETLRRMIEYTDCRLADDAKQEIARWPIAERAELESKRIVFCHGSPYSFKDHLEPEHDGFAELAKRIAAESPDAVFCGHTHRSRRFMAGRTVIFNAGAIGYSFEGITKASYGIIDIGREIVCQVKRIEYDKKRYQREIRSRQPVFMHNLLHALEYGEPFKG